VLKPLPFAILVCLASLSQTPAAQPTSTTRALADDYDVGKTITLKGTVRLSVATPGDVPVCFLMEVPRATGAPEHWMIAGSPARVLQRTGWRLEMLRGGTAVTVSGYLPRAGSGVAERLAAALLANAPPGMSPTGFAEELRKKDAHLAHAIDLTFADGRTIAFGER